MNLIFEELTTDHDRAGFDCDVSPLNDFLKKAARQNQEAGVSRTFVAVQEENPKTIVGYYCVSAGQIAFASLPTPARKGIPKYPVPVMRIGRLAVDKRFRGQKVGEELLMNAYVRALDAAKTIGIYAIVVDAKDEKAKSFYKHFDFMELADDPMALVIQIGTVKDSIT
ncbi:MAG: GNAT family N-acetyltransferase [Bdellovibrionales bacterium]|nr:GNAT family N-acetyltransferase [Bdellovibrionales bacterium]